MRIFAVLLGLWTALLVGLSVRFASRRDSGPTGDTGTSDVPADRRTPILLTATARATVLSEMRTMLGSVQGVLEGASRSDTVAIKAAALASGVVMAADPALENELPKEFLQFGMTVHRAFDSMAANAAAGPNDAVKRLATIAATCVECHALYRIQVK